MFKNQRYCTRGISEEVPLILQAALWNMIDTMKVSEKDYLQVFKLSNFNGKQKIIHSQEQPEYKKEHYIKLINAPLYTGKIFVIDDVEYSTMLKAEEY